MNGKFFRDFQKGIPPNKPHQYNELPECDKDGNAPQIRKPGK